MTNAHDAVDIGSPHFPERDKWIEHDGEGMPVAPETMVRLKFREGATEDVRADHYRYLWKRGESGHNPEADIIAYQVIAPQEPNARQLERELGEMQRQRAELFDKLHGTPCEQIRHTQEVENLREELAALAASRDWSETQRGIAERALGVANRRLKAREQPARDEREAFEAEQRKHLHPSLAEYALTLDAGDNSRYVVDATEHRWIGWQARAALAPPAPEQAASDARPFGYFVETGSSRTNEFFIDRGLAYAYCRQFEDDSYVVTLDARDPLAAIAAKDQP